jgi:hypothetical protein
MKTPTEGPLYARYGPYVRNIQPVTDSMFIAEACRGTKGRGRVWFPILIVPDPEAGTPRGGAGSLRGDWMEGGYVKAATGYSNGLFKTVLWKNHDNRYLNSVTYLPSDGEAVSFMIHAGKEFFK